MVRPGGADTGRRGRELPCYRSPPAPTGAGDGCPRRRCLRPGPGPHGERWWWAMDTATSTHHRRLGQATRPSAASEHPRPRRHVGKVHNPQRVRTAGGEVPFDQVRWPARGRIGLGRHELSATANPGQAGGAHQPLDGAAGHHDTLAAQLVPHLAHPAEAPADRRIGVYPPDLYQRRFVADRTRRARPGPVRVVGARGDLAAMLGEHRADRLDPEPVPVGVAELDYHGSRGSSSRAKKLDAANKISLARLSSRTSRSSSLTLLASAAGIPGRSPASMAACFTQPAQRVRIDPDPRTDPHHRLIHRQRRLLHPGLRHEPLSTQPQLVGILPRCWHDPTLPWVHTLHQTRGGSDHRHQEVGSAPGLVDTRGGWFSGRFCGRVDHLKLGWGEFAEGSLSTSSVVLGFDPDHDRQS